MMMLSCKNISKFFGTHEVLKDISFAVNSRDKIGLIGSNGAGKTTLFRILTGEISPDGGDITISKSAKIGYVKQTALAPSSKSTIWDEVEGCFSHIINVEEKLAEIVAQLEIPEADHSALTKKQAALNEEFLQLGGFGYKSRIRAALLGLGFAEDEFGKPAAHLSGGQQTRLALCKILLSDNDLLLLDEPTNNLDIKSCEWLEEYLRTFNGAFVVVSHDRYFLDKVTNVTVGIENGKSITYKGNYTNYINQKEIDNNIASRHLENYNREVARLEAIIEQQRRWNREKNIKTAESKQKQIDRMEVPDMPENEQSGISFKFGGGNNCGNEVLEMRGISKSYAHILFQNMDMFVKKGEKVFLLGDNGVGKTTLFNIITNETAPDCGTVKLGTNVILGYYSQTRSDLNPDNSVLDEVWNANPKMKQTDIRNALASFLFTGDDVFKPISTLSGGEEGRVSLVKLMLSKSNFLLMDEPTNHLDIKSKEALEQALDGYEGTVLIISHDRYFINKLATKIYCLESDGATCYNGDYEYYLRMHSQKADSTSAQKAKPSGIDYKEQKEYQSSIRKLKGKISRCEEQIALHEEKISQIEKDLLMPENVADYVKVSQLADDIEEEKNNLEHEYNNWHKLCEELEDMGSPDFCD